MLCSSGAVADDTYTYSPLPAPDVDGIITIDKDSVTYNNPDGYYVSLGAGENHSTVSEEIRHNVPIALHGYLADTSAQGAVDGKTFNISSKFTNNSSNPYINIYLYAGYSRGSGNVTNNTLNFSGNNTLSNTSFDWVYLYGGRAKNGNASGNTVNSTGSINAQRVNVYGGRADAGEANENKVYLTGGTFNGNVEVYGGYGNTSASNNELYVAGSVNLDNTALYGGQNASTMTGNRLIFGFEGKAWTPDNYTIKSVNNFSTIRFDNATWGKTITITNFANASTDSTDPTVTKIDATKVAFSGVDALSRGDSYDMLTIKTISSGSIELTSTSSTYTLGTTLQGTGTVSISDKTGDGNNDTVTYTINSDEKVVPSGDSSSGGDSSSDNKPAFDPQPQTHGVSMVNAAVTTALTQGADTTSAAISNLSTSGSLGVQSFSSVGGGASRTETGSHVSAYGLNFSVGAGNNIKTDFGLLSFGGAFEAGYGKFKNSYNAGDAEPYIGKKGHYSYYGVALMGNYAFENLYHVNAALRVGKNQEQSE